MILAAGDRRYEHYASLGATLPKGEGARPCGRCLECQQRQLAALQRSRQVLDPTRVPVTAATKRAGDRWWLARVQQQLQRRGFDFSDNEATRWVEQFEGLAEGAREFLRVGRIVDDERGFIAMLQQGVLFGDGQFELVYSGSVSGIWRPKTVGEQFVVASNQTINFRVNRHRPMSWIGAAGGAYGGNNNGSTDPGAGAPGGAWQGTPQSVTVLTATPYTISCGANPGGTTYFSDGSAYVMRFTGATQPGQAIGGPAGSPGAVLDGVGTAGTAATLGGGANPGCTGGSQNGADGTGNAGASGGFANDGGTGAGCGGATATGAGEAPPDGYAGGSGRSGAGYGAGGGGQGAQSLSGGGPGGSAYQTVIGPSFFILYA